MYLKLAWRNLWRNRRRTIITVASIFFAVLFAIVMKGVKEGTYERMIGNMVAVFSGYIQVQDTAYFDEPTPDHSFEIDESLRKQIANLKSVKMITPRIEGRVLVSSDSMTRGGMVLGIDPDLESERSSLHEKIIKGAYLKQDDNGILLAAGLAKKLRVGVGDTIVILGQGFHAVTAAGKYPVRGIVKLPVPDMDKILAYLPIDQAHVLFDLDNRLGSWLVEPERSSQMVSIQKEISKILPKDLRAMSWMDMAPELKQMIDGDRVEGYVFMGILYLIIAFGIFGTLLMMMAERSYEFGVMIALGFRKIRIAYMLLLETVIIGLLGTIAGILGGYPIVRWLENNPIQLNSDMAKMTEEYGFEAVISSSSDPSIFIEQGVTVLIITMVVSSYALWALKKTNPVEAMRKV